MEPKQIKSLDEILAEMIATANDPEVPAYDEISWKRIIKTVDRIAELSDKLKALSHEEPDLLTEQPFLVLGPYLRPEYISKISAVIEEIEELIYIYSNSMNYDPFVVGREIGACRKKNHQEVKICIEEDRILIRMPHLPQRYKSGKDLANQMLAAKIYNTDNFPVWPEWTAHYYHVFPSNTADIPKDVDNYAYKRTNDMLSYALGTSDNSLRFSMSMTTVFTDDLAPGVYIEITPKNSENIDFMQKVFGQN